MLAWVAAMVALAGPSAREAAEPRITEAESLRAISVARPIANRVFAINCTTATGFTFGARAEGKRLIARITRKEDGHGVRVTMQRSNYRVLAAARF
ncbi:hypothetical protein D9601_14985 [Sphingomonas sp. MA1305]|uniref:hypothetical protein n=1 Tax=Sphingomonas sp. MA1305 TaxID=2479204 RepID=UPI0018DF1106|nr:hypothetical protein [Sphingomonas sp. MA1305]MBI0476652.1 hypothetical protein [Sphingomonas sp. MA1305]